MREGEREGGLGSSRCALEMRLGTILFAGKREEGRRGVCLSYH